MHYLEFDSKSIPFKGSPRTFFIYNREFERDLFVDLDIAFSLGSVINRTIATSILWSLCFTASEKTLPYYLWIKEIDYDRDEFWEKKLIKECNNLDIVVKINELETNSKEVSYMSPRESALRILVNAKIMGLSFEELDTFTMMDYIEYIDSYTGDTGPRKATQADIDSLFF